MPVQSLKAANAVSNKLTQAERRVIYAICALSPMPPTREALLEKFNDPDFKLPKEANKPHARGGWWKWMKQAYTGSSTMDMQTLETTLAGLKSGNDPFIKVNANGAYRLTFRGQTIDGL